MSEEQTSKLTSKKKGGPYTKAEQEKRRIKVYELYFEKGYSATKIAEELGVNRNTINDDIKSWYGEMAAQIGVNNVGTILLKQIERLEIQRRRLVEQIEGLTNFEKKITVEKMIFDIDNKIAGFAAKMAGKDLGFDRYDATEEISDKEISEIVRYLIFDAEDFGPVNATEDSILKNIIKKKKCDVQYARNVVSQMGKLGLQLYNTDFHVTDYYNLLNFASMRGYITKEQQTSYEKKIKEKEKKEFDEESKEIEKKSDF